MTSLVLATRADVMPGKISCVTANGHSNPAQHFGRQVKKERLARGWSLPELAQRTGINAGHLSRIENGKRPPTEKVATEMDAAFPERRGWFLEYFSEMRGWSEVPASFRDWAELELGATRLHAWSPGVLHGLLQTEQYASALLATLPDVTADVITARTVSRLDRQRRVLLRDERPETWFVVDEHSLYRLVGSTGNMATQMRRLAEVAALPRVTVQVLPAIAHPAGASGFIVTDSAAYVEHVASGYVFTDEQTVSTLKRMFDTLRGECYRVSESLKMIERLGKAWAGGKAPTPTRPEAIA
jgi:transcriptional regulator with XRE-family HTH domain